MSATHCGHMSDGHEAPKREETFNKADDFSLHFEERIPSPPTFERLRAKVQGQCLFLGAYWMYVHEARALRDWLNKVLPDKPEDQTTPEAK